MVEISGMMELLQSKLSEHQTQLEKTQLASTNIELQFESYQTKQQVYEFTDQLAYENTCYQVVNKAQHDIEDSVHQLHTTQFQSMQVVQQLMNISKYFELQEFLFE